MLDIALGLTLLARRLERLEAGHVANGLLHLSYSVLDAARRLAVNERDVSVGEESRGVKITNLGSEDMIESGLVYRGC